MTKMMTGMAVARQKQYEEARTQTHKYCCLVNQSNTDIATKESTLAHLTPADLENLEAHHLDFL